MLLLRIELSGAVLGIDEVVAEALPADKADKIRHTQKQREVIAMDGRSRD
ncbi:MAG: hypothetical protein WC560_04960 [Syntrophales bacterium]